jgi:molybdopterin-guanine dinucleotide biosynthesis protein A
MKARDPVVGIVLAGGKSAVRNACCRLPAGRFRPCGSRTIDPFFNVNRPDDLDAAEAFLQTSVV